MLNSNNSYSDVNVSQSPFLINDNDEDKNDDKAGVSLTEK